MNKNFLTGILFALCIGCLSGLSCASAQDADVSDEYEIKTRFIFHFVKFTRWPKQRLQNRKKPIIIGFISEFANSNSLFKLKHIRIRGRKILVRKVRHPNDLNDCNVLYIDMKDRVLIRKYLNLIRGKSILTIGDAKDFIRMGGTINFLRDTKKRLRFEVGLYTATDSGLKLSSKLLKSAKNIYKKKE
ncbi:YfiR family protein [Desulfobacterales bacterium HSG16]|nr:YfiR family protein [Desulfobacterales bacterium HSG16]